MDHQAILENAPLPIIIVQDLQIVYANRAFIEVTRSYGYDFSDESVVGIDLMRMVAPEEREASQVNIARMLEGEEKVHRNTPRKLIAAGGEQHAALVSTSRIEWNGRPALVTSFVILGLDFPEDVGGEASERITDHRREALVELTPREQEVAHLVANGYSTDNVSALLGVEESTVRSHIKSIFKKTGTRSRIELTRLLIGFR